MESILFLLLSCSCICPALAAFTVFHGTNATEVNSKLSLNNKELLRFAAKTGESVSVEVAMPFQTVLTQHQVSVQLDCGSLMEFAPLGVAGASIFWSKLNINSAGEVIDESFEDIPSYSAEEGIYVINGSHDSVLNLFTSIISDAGRIINTHGIFRCELCYVPHVHLTRRSIHEICPIHRNVTVFVVGGPPIIDSGRGIIDPIEEEPLTYKVGTDFCLEQSSGVQPLVKLRCDLTDGSSVSPAVPLPKVTWLHANTVVYDGDVMDPMFFMEGINFLLAPGFVHPTPLFISSDYSLTFDLQAVNVTSLGDYPEITNSNVQEVLFNLILGPWTCIQNNSYGNVNETTLISYCGVASGTLSFEVSKLLADESTGHVEMCVRRTGTIQDFQVYSEESSAKENADYISINTTMAITGLRKCFEVDLINDNSSEPVEVFKLYLDVSTPGNEIFINRSLTIIITDNDYTDSEEVSTCSLNGYLLVDTIQEEKEQVVETIRNLLPFDLPDPVSSDPKSSTQSTQVYEQLAELYEESPSTEGRDRFTAAVDEIYTAYTTECTRLSSEDIRGTSDITSLAAKFEELTNRLNSIRYEDLAQARDIYGKFLCFQKKAGGHRQKRQYGQYNNRTNCDCPDNVIEPCHFFACLDVDTFKFIAGFGNSVDEQPCISFIVDTTGSMQDEIAAAKRIILQFIRSQADSTWCYLLVPFNDHGIIGHPDNVGPIRHVFTDGSISELESFKAAVRALKANGGGTEPEYAFSAMLEALDYSFIDEYGESFTPMHYNSEMIVITDATSLLPNLRDDVICKAIEQGVSIHFILNVVPRSYYEDVASETGGIIYDDSHTSWSIINFHSKFSGSGRKKRSAVSDEVSVRVSRFVYALTVSILTDISTATASITLPDGSVESADIIDSVMIYLKSNPLPGLYLFTVSATVEDVLIQQDTSLDIGLLYLDSNFTVSSPNPLPACTTGKLALTTSRSQEISSLTLNVTNSTGSSQLIPLTKCSNAFTRDYQFRAGNYTYQVHGVDTDGIDFTYDLKKSAVVRPSPSGTYSIQATNSTKMTIELSDHFTMTFKLRSNDHIGTTNFTLSVNAEGFATTLDRVYLVLQPMEVQTVTLSGSVGSSSVGGGKTSNITITASNGCVTLSAFRLITVKALATIAPSALPTNECGCLNGGTCTVVTRRGRTFRRCSCTPEYGGLKCGTSL